MLKLQRRRKTCPTTATRRKRMRYSQHRCALDCQRCGPHNRGVKARTCPPGFVLFAGLLVVWTPLVPAHLHEAEAHDEATVHRHFSPHLTHEHGSDVARLDHPERPIVWLSESWLHASTYQINQVFTVAPFAVALAADTDRGTPPRFNEVAPPHGPPRPSRSLRAPPLPFPAVI